MRQYKVSSPPKPLYLGKKFQMASITISELCSTDTEQRDLSTLELKAVLGGREVVYWDADGDGFADYKVVIKKNKIKFKAL
jgi:hypothetical protein